MTRSRRIAQDNKSASALEARGSYAAAMMRRSVPSVGVGDAFVARVAQLALMAHGGGHRRNSDLAVAVVELAVTALGVLGSAPLLLIDCMTSLFLASQRFRYAYIWSPTGAEMRRQSCPIVAFGRDSERALSRRDIPTVKVNPALTFYRQACDITGSRPSCPAGLAQCGILATGPQEGPVNRPEIVAMTRFFRLIAAQGLARAATVQKTAEKR